MFNLRQVATLIIAVAVTMRASVPVGWMTNAADQSHQATLIPCPMMDGMAMPKQPQPSQHPTKHHTATVHEGSICPFATPPQPARAVTLHRVEIAPSRFAFFAPALTALASPWDHIPRAPPGQDNATAA